MITVYIIWNLRVQHWCIRVLTYLIASRFVEPLANARTKTSNLQVGLPLWNKVWYLFFSFFTLIRSPLGVFQFCQSDELHCFWGFSCNVPSSASPSDHGVGQFRWLCSFIIKLTLLDPSFSLLKYLNSVVSCLFFVKCDLFPSHIFPWFLTSCL